MQHSTVISRIFVVSVMYYFTLVTTCCLQVFPTSRPWTSAENPYAPRSTASQRPASSGSTKAVAKALPRIQARP